MESNNHIHKFENIVIPATCKENGYTLHKCECGYEHKDSFTPVGDHTFNLIEETKSSCTESGEKNYRCTVCGETKLEKISPLGHTWGEWQIQKYPACVEKGTEIRICSQCGQIEEREVAETGHKLISPKKSETQKGYVDYFCENCGQTITVPSSSKKAVHSILKHKKAIFVSLVAVILAVGLFFATTMFFVPYYHYSRATSLIEEENYTEAYLHLKQCKNFKDSQKMLRNFVTIYDARIGIDRDGKIISKNEYKYDENNNKISDIEYDEGGQVLYKYEYEYDENDNLTREITYNKYDTAIFERGYTNEYDENGKLIIRIEHDESGQVLYKYEYEYDENDDLIIIICYDKDWHEKHDSIISKRCYEYKYDKNGNLTNERWCYEGGFLIYEFDYEYDENDNKILEIRHNENGDIDTCEYEYDENYTLTFETYYDEDGKVMIIYEYINPRIIYKP